MPQVLKFENPNVCGENHSSVTCGDKAFYEALILLKLFLQRVHSVKLSVWERNKDEDGNKKLTELDLEYVWSPRIQSYVDQGSTRLEN